MITFSFYSFRIFKISPYINFEKILGRILAPPSGRRPGADAPPPAPLRSATALRPLRDLQYGLGETVFGGCRHLEYMNIWGFNEPKYYFVCLRQEAQMVFF